MAKWCPSFYSDQSTAAARNYFTATALIAGQDTAKDNAQT